MTSGPRPTAAEFETFYQRVINLTEASLRRAFAEEWARIRPGEPMPDVRAIVRTLADRGSDDA